jgi:hypothetical protein
LILVVLKMKDSKNNYIIEFYLPLRTLRALRL